MQKKQTQTKIGRVVEIVIITLFCALIVLLDFVRIPFSEDEFCQRMLSKILQQSVGSGVAIWCIRRFGFRLFGKPQNCLYLLPCLLVAIDNFQWSAYFSGKMQLARTSMVDVALFTLNCLTTGLFEELVFRGILFSVILGYVSTDKKGFLIAYALSSVLFGLAHLLNGFSAATLLQVGYSILTGGLFAFCLIKTRNVLCCAFVHGLYNFCGLLYDTEGLGYGVIFDVGTVVTMLIVSVAVGVFVIYKVWKYPVEERQSLYDCIGVKNNQ